MPQGNMQKMAFPWPKTHVTLDDLSVEAIDRVKNRYREMFNLLKGYPQIEKTAAIEMIALGVLDRRGFIALKKACNDALLAMSEGLQA